MYAPELAAALSGTTRSQLQHWRTGNNPLLIPECRDDRGRVFYSWRDLLALRTVGKLRSSKSLQAVRRAVTNAQALDELAHLSEYVLVEHEGSILWIPESDSYDGGAVDVYRRPGQRVLATMIEVMGPFRSRTHQDVVALQKPTDGVALDPDILGGYPAIDGTRVPFDVVADLAADGVQPEGIRHFYPTVPADSVAGAVEFAKYVQRYNLHQVEGEAAAG